MFAVDPELEDDPPELEDDDDLPHAAATRLKAVATAMIRSRLFKSDWVFPICLP